jgi:hypothetical protein
MTGRSTIKIDNVSTPELTEPSRVFDYLENTLFRPINVSRIQAGATNYGYRFFPQPVNHGKDQTAILKYSAPHMGGESSVPFSSERSTFEACALIYIPWQTFQYSTISRTCPRVDLPKVYFQDTRNHILVIEDCTPERSGQTTNINHVEESKKKHDNTSVIGGMLGVFLAQLQSWGLQPQHNQTALELFETNE